MMWSKLLLLHLLLNTDTALSTQLENFDPEDLVDWVKLLERGEKAGSDVPLDSEENVNGGLNEEGVGGLNATPIQTQGNVELFDVNANQDVTLVGKVSGVVVDDEDEVLGVGGNSSNPQDQWVLPRDLSDLGEDIAVEVSAGVEESLRLFHGDQGNRTEVETRQLPMYMFQGQYVAEPRLNRFIDGAIRNMGNEVRSSQMDPIFFRILPKGRVTHRGTPINFNQNQLGNKTKGKRRRPGNTGRRRRDAEVVRNFNSTRAQRRKQLLRRRRRQQQLLRQRRRRQNKKGLFSFNNKKKGIFSLKKKNVNAVKNRRRRRRNQQRKVRARRRVRMAQRNVGGGKVEGLSRVVRDGDAEMQLFGNYTLIRSHMKVGPVELTMQFRTKRGIRRTGATLPIIRAHTVTRVNHEGSEMVDFLLDRPHPETIQLRGNLFPTARKIAKNIFSRLFLSDSFLMERMREKTALALASRPTIA